MSAFNPNEHLSNLKGRSYLEVKWRLVWFRLEKEGWGIRTSLVQYNEQNKQAIFKAEIVNEKGEVVSTGYGSETLADFKDFLEKAETKAVGRALAMLGYGTQFAPEFDEGERLVDAPVDLSTGKCADATLQKIRTLKEENRTWKPTQTHIEAMNKAFKQLKDSVDEATFNAQKERFNKEYHRIIDVSCNSADVERFVTAVGKFISKYEENSKKQRQELDDAANAAW